MPGSNLFSGTLDLLILRSLVWGPLHGYGIGRWIRRTSSEILSIEEGALYPALHRMQKKGWLQSDWGLTETRRQAKFYSLTDLGREHLNQETKRWEEHAMAVRSVLQGSREAEASP